MLAPIYFEMRTNVLDTMRSEVGAFSLTLSCWWYGNEPALLYWWCHAGHKKRVFKPTFLCNRNRPIDTPQGNSFTLLTQMATSWTYTCPWRWLMKRNCPLLFPQGSLSPFCPLLVYWASSLMAHLHQNSVRELKFAWCHPKAKKLDKSSMGFTDVLLQRVNSHSTARVRPLLHSSGSARLLRLAVLRPCFSRQGSAAWLLF